MGCPAGLHRGDIAPDAPECQGEAPRPDQKSRWDENQKADPYVAPEVGIASFARPDVKRSPELFTT